MNINLNDKEQMKSLIESGTPCFYRRGFAFHFRSNGGRMPITKEKAIELLPVYSPGMGFYELCLETVNGKRSFVFNEYSESDLM